MFWRIYGTFCTLLYLGISLDWLDKTVYWSSGTSTGSIRFVSQTTGDDYTLVSDLDYPSGLKVLALET